MAHPKRRQSTTRRDKRRTHYKAIAPQLAKDTTTGELHLFHRAHWHEGKLYYKGKVVLEKEVAVIEEN
jgi:large subunit ribosomal protein L32